MIWSGLADGTRVVAFDFETSGQLDEYALQPWRWQETPQNAASWVTSVSWVKCVGDTLRPSGGKLFPTVKHMRTLLDEAVEEGYIIVTWNGVFDIAWLCAMGLGDLVMKIKWLDGMLLWRHLEVEPEYEFKTARHKRKRWRLKPEGVERFLPVMAGYQEDVEFHRTDSASLKKLQKYNDDDSIATWTISYIIWEQLTPAQRNCALIEAESLPMIAQANLRGMPVDTIATRALGAKLDQVAEDMLTQLEPHGVTEKIVRSPAQLSTLMFDEWGLTPIKKSKTTGKPSTDKETLHELSFVDNRVKLLRQYREALNNKAKFSTTILNSVAYNNDGNTRPAGIPFGTYSGRLTYASAQGKGVNKRQTGFALHQEKREAEYREALCAPPGYTLMEFDASGQEFRWMAIASNDPTMLHLCMPGEDAHSYMGAQIVSYDYHELMKLVAAEDKLAKNNRQLGKVANLSLQYRTSAPKLRSVARVQYRLPMELPEAQRIHSTYQKVYSRVPVYWDNQIALTKRLGYVETFAGRRVQVVGDWEGEWGWSMGSTSINYRIQGTGADQKYLAMAAIKDYLNNINAYFTWDLHDGIYIYVPDAMVERAAVDIKAILDHLPYKERWNFVPPVPLPWDCKAGKSWGALKGWDYG